MSSNDSPAGARRLYHRSSIQILLWEICQASGTGVMPSDRDLDLEADEIIEDWSLPASLEQALADIRPPKRPHSYGGSTNHENTIPDERTFNVEDLESPFRGKQLQLHQPDWHQPDTPEDQDQIRPMSRYDQNRESRKSKIERHLSKASRMSRMVSTRSKLDNSIPPATIPLSNPEKSVVGWDSPDDPQMPLNFATSRKYLMVCMLSLFTFMSPLSSSILAPAIRYFAVDFNSTNETLASMPVSIYLLGYAVGPLFLSPLSEIYGRWIVLTSSNAFFCAWHIGCALAPNLGTLIAFRFLSGVGGSACMTLGGGIIADLFPLQERGKALSIWTIGPLIGPTLGPIIGAFIAGSIGWRWSPWIVMIPSVVITVILAIVLPETNHKVLIERKMKRVSKATGARWLKSCYEIKGDEKLSTLRTLKAGLVRPLKFLFMAPMVSLLSIYISFVYGTIYLMYNTVPQTFETEYGWSTGLTGLPFLSLSLGYAAGLFSFSMVSDRTVVRLTKANGGTFEPEMRLPIVVYYAMVVPVTFFWYGWTAYFHKHWIIPVLGLFPLGFGILGIWMPAQAYIIDAYPMYAASGLAAFTVLRSVVAAFLPLAGPAVFGNLGLGWGNSVLGFVCVAMIPVPIIMHRFGKRIRLAFPIDL